MPDPPETMRTSAVQCRGDFRKKVFRPPSSEGRKWVCYVRSSQKPDFRKSRRQLHPAGSDLPRSRIRARSASPPSQIHATAACMYIIHDARCLRRGVLGAERMATRIGRGPTWQVCIRRHVAGVYTAAHPENSGFPVRMRLRSWVRRAKVVRVVDAFDFGPSINGGGSVPAGAHVQRECGRAMPRPRRHFADLRYPVTPTLAHKLEWTHDGTDFRPSRNGDGAAPACAHIQRECGRAMALQRGHFAGLGYPVTPMLAHMLWRGRSMGQIFDHRETEMGLCQLARTVSESVEERWRDGAGRL